MLVALEAADRLACVLAERGPLALSEAAVHLLAVRAAPPRRAEALLRRALAADGRFIFGPTTVALAPAPEAEVPLAQARFAVIDLETRGLAPARGAIVEAACVRLEAGGLVAERCAISVRGLGDDALGRVLALAGDAALAGHNLAFDVRFLDARLRRRGARLAAPLVDTLALARRLLEGRAEGCSLAALARFFGVSTLPAHRALPDARAAAEVLLRLVELAEERGARTVGDLCALGRPAGSVHTRGGAPRAGRPSTLQTEWPPRSAPTAPRPPAPSPTGSPLRSSASAASS